MNKKLLAELLATAFKLKFLEGYRTYIGAVGLLALAVYLLTQGQYEQALTNLSLALAALGIGEKVNDLFEEEGEKPAEDEPPAEPPTTG